MKKLFLYFFYLYSVIDLWAQATFSSGVYTQNFGTAPGPGFGAWTNNSTYVGWYLDNPAHFQGTINITAAAPSNNGGQYMYTCNAASNLLLGTRPSNGSGGPPCTDATCGHKLGLRLQNNTGTTINSIRVQFDWYQLSLAENNGVTNNMFFHYQTGTTVTSVTSGTWTAVASLNFTAPNDHPGPGTSNQVEGYPWTVTGNKSHCIAVSIPEGNEIMLRWSDPNNSYNDPHLAIDNITVTAYSDAACINPLPVELLSFSTTKYDKNITLHWETASKKI
jgi:hypothetical protein